METVTRGKRASEKQKDYLINYLEDNVDLANDKFVTADGARFREQMWCELATTLNALGGTQKDGPKWRKYWSDLRLHTRTKYSAIKQAEKTSGINGLSRVKALSSLEERVIKITIIEAVDDDDTPEVGFEQTIAVCRQIDDSVESVEVLRGFDSDGYAAAGKVTTTKVISGSNIPAAATIRGKATAPSRSRKKRAQPETPYLEKLFKIEEKKLTEMETANTLKREQIARQIAQEEAILKQTVAIEADTQAKKDMLARLTDLFNILVQRT